MIATWGRRMKKSKTSLSHPLEITELATGDAHGKIGVTFAPGKYDLSGSAGSWDRDLTMDLDRIADWGAKLVLTLLEDHELTLLRIQNLGHEVLRKKYRMGPPSHPGR